MKLRKISKDGNWKVFGVCTNRGECAVERFLEELGPNLEANVSGMYALLDRVAEHGPPNNTDLSHQLRGDIWEFIKGRIRILYFCDRGRVIVCTHCVLKTSQKMPRAEIARAEDVQRRYREARDGGRLEIVTGDDND